MGPWYQKLFENYANRYDQEPFVKGTSGECNFIESEIGFRKDSRILDIACGTGRHSVELAKRGYNVTGIDFSAAQLKKASEKALQQNVKVDFQLQDARQLPFSNEFEMALMICEGAFPLMETDEMNFEILKSASGALKSNGKLILTTLNGLFPLFHSVKDFLDSHSEQEYTLSDIGSFDLMAFRFYSTMEFTDDSGNRSQIECNERYYVPSEITWLLKSLDFKVIEIYGARLGAFSRNNKLTTEDFEMLVVAEK